MFEITRARSATRNCHPHHARSVGRYWSYWRVTWNGRLINSFLTKARAVRWLKAFSLQCSDGSPCPTPVECYQWQNRNFVCSSAADVTSTTPLCSMKPCAGSKISTASSKVGKEHGATTTGNGLAQTGTRSNGPKGSASPVTRSTRNGVCMEGLQALSGMAECFPKGAPTSSSLFRADAGRPTWCARRERQELR